LCDVSVPWRRTPNLAVNTEWTQNAVTVAGGNGRGNELNQLFTPRGVCVDPEDHTVYIPDYNNHRIMAWKPNESTGQVLAGGNGRGNGADQLCNPTDVILDRETDSLIISDFGNGRVVRWPRQNGTRGETLISDVGCYGLTMDNDGSLYVVDHNKDEVKRYDIGETDGTVVAGGMKQGDHLDQLFCPTYAFVDRDQSLYVSDWNNHRVMKWMKNSKKGIVVAGGQGAGNGPAQLSQPCGVVVDGKGSVYVADCLNHRIVRWTENATQGSVIIGGNGAGNQSNQLCYPTGLALDREGNLYVSDYENHRVQRFSIDQN
jgi:sugar lactone lactonase YvrE